MNHELVPFSLNNLPEHRIDLAARCINAAFWLDHDIRRDVVIYFHFKNNKVVRIDGKVKNMNPDERNISSFFLHIQEGKTYPGIQLSEKTFDELISEFSDVYYTDANGEDFTKTEFVQDVVFVFGDNKGYEDHSTPEDAKKLNLGPKSYITSHCIAVLNNHLDRLSL